MSEKCVVFKNPGVLDIDMIRTFGVSVKVNDNPYGKFGTGLKYAIAVCLREGQQVKIFAGPNTYELSTETRKVRGETPYDFVVCRDQEGNKFDLGFTTHFGTNWEMWQAFRELYSNMVDEGGEASVQMIEEDIFVSKNETSVVITGKEMAKAYDKRDEVFLFRKDRPLIENHSLRVFSGPSQFLYYNGVRASNLDSASMYTYDFKTPGAELTEDRTIKNVSMCQARIAWLVGESCEDEELIERILRCPVNCFEKSLSFSSCGESVSNTFLEVVRRNFHLVNSDEFNQTARALYSQMKKKILDESFEVPTTEMEKKKIAKATKFLIDSGYDIMYPVIVVETLGPGIFGLAQHNKIFITKGAVDMGTKFIASTLLEEYLHLKHSFDDCSRELQNWLFERVLSLMEEISGEPL